MSEPEADADREARTARDLILEPITYQWLYEQLAVDCAHLDDVAFWVADFTGCSPCAARAHVGTLLRAAESQGALLFSRGRWLLTAAGRAALARMRSNHAA